MAEQQTIDLIALRKLAEAVHEHDPEDNWAKVELFRWQYGELPQPQNGRLVDIPKALEGMAKLIKECRESGNIEKLPMPQNVADVLIFIAKLIRASADPSTLLVLLNRLRDSEAAQRGNGGEE